MELMNKVLSSALGAWPADETNHATVADPNARIGRYDRLVDALNRLPRPALAYGAVALLGFAMLDPAGFVQRMKALESAPTELWWLLGAVIAGHFGAREAHHLRHRPDAAPKAVEAAPGKGVAPAAEGD